MAGVPVGGAHWRQTLTEGRPCEGPAQAERRGPEQALPHSPPEGPTCRRLDLGLTGPDYVTDVPVV